MPLGKPLELLRPEIHKLKQSSDLTPRVFGNDDGTGLRERLQSGSEVRRLADHRLFLRRTGADKIADHDEPRGDSDAHLQSRCRLECANCIDQGESSTYCALGVVLMRLQIPEIREHTVAHILCDKAPRLADLCCAAAVIGADNVSHVFGIELGGKRSRADEVDEYDCELPTFGREL